MINFNLNSLDHLSVLMFGGELKDSVVEPIFDESGNPVLIKSGERKGQIKTHKVEVKKKIKGLLDNEGLKYSKPLKKEGFFSTDEATLSGMLKTLDQEREELIYDFDKSKDIERTRNIQLVMTIIELLLEIRGLEKKISTYYKATEELVYDIDSCVHPQFQHTSTDTGRLSCKVPNAQNQPNDEVLKHFTSRYKE